MDVSKIASALSFFPEVFDENTTTFVDFYASPHRDVVSIDFTQVKTAIISH